MSLRIRRGFIALTLAFASVLAACNSNDSVNGDGGDGGGGGGSGSGMRYDGQQWNMVAGICPGTTEYISSFAMTRDEESRVLYVRTSAATVAAGSYPVAGGASGQDSIAAGTVGISLYDVDYNAIEATSGTVQVTRPSGSKMRFEAQDVALENGKTVSFDVVASNCQD